MPRKLSTLLWLPLCVCIAVGAGAAPQQELPLLQKREASATNPVFVMETFDPARPLPAFFAGSPIELEYLMFAGPRDRQTPPAGVYSFMLPDALFVFDENSGQLSLNLPVRTAEGTSSPRRLTALRAASYMPADSSMTAINGCARDGAPPVYNIVVLDQPLNVTQLVVPMPREKAEEARPNLRALVAVRLDANAGYVFTQWVDEPAPAARRYTIQPLKDVRRLRDCELALGGHLESIRVYDFRTGEVHATYTLAEVGATDDPSSYRAAVMNLLPAKYSAQAKRARLRGPVVAQVTIGADGALKDVRIMQSLPLGLDEAVEKAIRASSFEPAMRDGVLVETTVAVTYRFDPRMGEGLPEKK